MVAAWCATARVLISADALWENGFGVVFPELDERDAAAEQHGAGRVPEGHAERAGKGRRIQ